MPTDQLAGYGLFVLFSLFVVIVLLLYIVSVIRRARRQMRAIETGRRKAVTLDRKLTDPHTARLIRLNGKPVSELDAHEAALAGDIDNNKTS